MKPLIYLAVRMVNVGKACGRIYNDE